MKGMGKGIGPNSLGSAAKMMKNSPLDIKTGKPGEPEKKETKSYEPTSLGGFGGPRYIAGKIGSGFDAVKKALKDADDFIGGRMNKAGTADLEAQRKRTASTTGQKRVSASNAIGSGSRTMKSAKPGANLKPIEPKKKLKR
tara:strand:+ start:660 stop:1082 length:423 start_codon:yes stop_codon:yes gene_type:complete